MARSSVNPYTTFAADPTYWLFYLMISGKEIPDDRTRIIYPISNGASRKLS